MSRRIAVRVLYIHRRLYRILYQLVLAKPRILLSDTVIAAKLIVTYGEHFSAVLSSPHPYILTPRLVYLPDIKVFYSA
ncbi:hypothetical protein [Candidatus Vallotia tarda]|uniref:hypothetical protein n=1 Tax=Candidatus Vallotiella hemipterorum TaxID=1177213 RepID=UPI001C1F97EB|nr:hypothetical protein [Candidatus Vallotia tarda]